MATNEYRISLIEFNGEVVKISNYWVDQAKFAMLQAALGEPEVDSLYSREAFRADKVLPEGVHFVKEVDK